MQASPPSTAELLHQGEIRWSPTSCPACHHSILSIIHLVSCTKHNYPKLIARDSGLDTMDLSTAMANHGVWEEISMTVLSTPVVKG